jgi:hypothetical protein
MTVTDHIAFGDIGAADLSGDGGQDIGVAKVDFGDVKEGFIGHDGGLGLFILRADLIPSRDSPGLLP